MKLSQSARQIKTWQDRMPEPRWEKVCDMNCSPRPKKLDDCPDCVSVKRYGDPIVARDAEIADLRAALARAPLPARANELFQAFLDAPVDADLLRAASKPEGPKRSAQAVADAFFPHEGAPLPAYRDGQEPLTVDDYQAKLMEVFIASFRAGPEGGKLVPSEEMARFYFKHVVQPAQGELLEVEKLEMLIHEITGYEGEDDAFTYLRRALSELMECRAKADAAPAQADDARDAAQRVERRIQSIWEDANTDWGDAVGGPPAHEIFARRLISAMQDEIAASLARKDKQ